MRRLPMNKKFYSFFISLLIAMLAFTPVYAGGVSGKVGLGSITFEGSAYGFSREAVTITLYAEGDPVVACHGPGNNKLVPGQNPVPVTGEASATYDLTADENGKFSIYLEAQPNVQNFTAKELGCPNNNWTAVVEFVYWDYVKITVTEISSGEVRWEKDSTCTTTRNPDTITCPAFD
jgi:hypothetical protein